MWRAVMLFASFMYAKFLSEPSNNSVVLKLSKYAAHNEAESNVLGQLI